MTFVPTSDSRYKIIELDEQDLKDVPPVELSKRLRSEQSTKTNKAPVYEAVPAE
jgi:hypothetical protein